MVYVGSSDNSNRGYSDIAGLQPVLVHLSKNAQGKFSFNPVSINFLVEVVKTTFAIGMLILYVSFSTLLSPMHTANHKLHVLLLY